MSGGLNIEQAALRIAAARLQDYRITSSRQVEALCPFPHPGQEVKRKRTFYISLDTGLWICHRCGRRGNIKTLAGRLHLDLDFAAEAVEEHRRYRALRGVRLDETADVLPTWVNWLFAQRGPRQLLEAGFTADILKQHGIGVDLELDRWTVPIFSRDGQLRAISGRATLPLQVPKYLVYRRDELLGLLSEETLENYAPKPRNYLWREHLLPDRVDTLVLCEGYKAAMWVAQHGYDSVALMSNMLSSRQLHTLRKLEPRRIILALDNDEAGVDGTRRTIKSVRHIARTFVMRYPAGADGFSPDDLAEEDLHHALGTSVTPIKWRLEKHVA